MARLFEYQGKGLLKGVGIRVPRGGVAATKEEARGIAADLGGAVAVKAQIWAGGRGKAGAIRFADSADEAAVVAGELLGAMVKGVPVRKVLVEEKLAIVREFYVGIIVDPSKDVRAPVVIVTSEGGWRWRRCLMARSPSR